MQQDTNPTVRLSQSERLYYVRSFLREGDTSIRKFCKTNALPFSSFKRWLNIYKETGSVPTNSRKKAGILNVSQERKILKIAKENPNCTVQKISELLDEEIPIPLLRRAVHELCVYSPAIQDTREEVGKLLLTPQQKQRLLDKMLKTKYKSVEDYASAIVKGEEPGLVEKEPSRFFFIRRTLDSSFAERLKHTRVCYGVTIFEAATRMKLPINTYRKFESGQFVLERKDETFILNLVQGANDLMPIEIQSKLLRDPDFLGGV